MLEKADDEKPTAYIISYEEAEAYIYIYIVYATGQAASSRVGGTYVACRHLVCAGSQAERGLTPSERGATAGADNCRNGCIGACCDGIYGIYVLDVYVFIGRRTVAPDPRASGR